MDPQILPAGHHIVIPAKDIDNNYKRDLDTFWKNNSLVTPYEEVINAINAINNIDEGNAIKRRKECT